MPLFFGWSSFSGSFGEVVRRLVPVVVTLLLGGTAGASHFRFGHMSWQRAAGQSNPLVVDITVIEAWREGTGGSGDILYTIDQTGTTFSTEGAPLTGTLQDFSGERYEIFTQTVRHTFPANGVYTVSSSTTFRLVDLANAPATPVTLGMTMDLRPSNSGTPLTTGPVILQLPVDSTNAVTIPIVDPDGDPLSVRFASLAESGFDNVPTVGGNPLQVTPSGGLVWNTTGGQVGQRFAVQLAIEERHPGFATSGRVPLEFILELVNLTTNQPPVCTGPTGRLSAQVGTPVTLSIEATDPEGGRLRVIGEQLPPGAVLTPASGTTNASPSTVSLAWVPGLNNFGQTYPVTIVFTDDHGLQGSCSFSISVDTQAPLPAYGQITSGATGTAAGASVNPAISREARFVVFTSDAANLVTNDQNGLPDVFVRDRATGETKLLSVNGNGVSANGASRGPVISADGRFVAFQSEATDLVENDANGRVDIFVHDLAAGSVRLVSATPGGASGAGDSSGPAFNGDGSRLVFVSTADDLAAGDTNRTADVFVRDLRANTTSLVSVNTNGVSGTGASTTPVISDSGRHVAFASAAPDLVTNDPNGLRDVFVRDLQTGVTTLVSVNTNGLSGNRLSFGPAISPDGFAVAFVTQATDLLPVTDTNLQTDVYLRDVAFGSNVLVSVTAAGTTGNAGSATPIFSADGQNVLFISIATDFVGSDNNGRQDVFLWNRQTRRVELVSVNAGGTGTANALSGITAASISRDNRYVTFFSAASDLIAGNADTNGVTDVFLRDRQARVTRLLSFNPATSQIADGASFSPFISGDGQTVVFATDARNLLTNDLNSATDIVAVNVTNATPSSLAAAVFVTAPGDSPAGVEFPVTVQVMNLGDEAIDNLRLANSATDGIRRLAASASRGQLDATTGDWVIGRLEPRAGAELTMTVCAEQTGVARLGAEVLPSGGAVTVSGRRRGEAHVQVTAAPVVEFQDYATYRGDADSPWPDDLRSGLTRRFAPGSGALLGVRVTEYGFGRVLRFDPDLLGALPARIGLVWSGPGAGLSVDVYDWRGRRIGRRTVGRSPVEFAGQRFLAVEHDAGIGMLVVSTDGRLEEVQLTVHSGVPVPEGLLFEANGDDAMDFAAGRIGGGYRCAVGDAGVVFRDVVPALAGEATLEFWVRSEKDLHSGTPATRLVTMPVGGVDVWFEAGFLRSRVPLAVGPSVVVSARADFAAGQWRHVAVVVDGDRVRLLLDGRVMAIEALAGGFAMSETDVVLGEGFGGCLDEVAVYSRALAEETVADLARQARRGKVRPQVRATYHRDVVELTWPTFFEGYVVQAAKRIGRGADWATHDQYKHVHGGTYEVSLPAAAGYRYFRLVRPTDSSTQPTTNNSSQ